jgi:CBS domain-containing protein
MATVTSLLHDKGPHEVWSIALEASVYEAIAMMAARGVGALVVLDGQTVVGMVSERDYARKVILQGKSSRDTPVRAIMTATVYYVHPEQTIDDCMALMTTRHIRHLPVVVDERLVGLVSIGDIVKALIDDQAVRIQQLEGYITGSR